MNEETLSRKRKHDDSASLNDTDDVDESAAKKVKRLNIFSSISSLANRAAAVINGAFGYVFGWKNITATELVADMQIEELSASVPVNTAITASESEATLIPTDLNSSEQIDSDAEMTEDLIINGEGNVEVVDLTMSDESSENENVSGDEENLISKQSQPSSSSSSSSSTKPSVSSAASDEEIDKDKNAVVEGVDDNSKMVKAPKKSVADVQMTVINFYLFFLLFFFFTYYPVFFFFVYHTFFLFFSSSPQI